MLLGGMIKGRVIGSTAALMLAACSEPATVGTFNIRLFPEPSTDRSAVAQAIADTQADVLAIQEIRSASQFEAMLRVASKRGGRDYRLLPGPCGGDGFELTTGVVYDAAQWSVVAQRNFPDLGRSDACGDWQPATAAVLEKGRRRLLVTSIHFVPFPDRFDERTQQWPRALSVMADLEREFDPDASVMMGDTNSTGFRDQPPREADFVRDAVRESGRALATKDTECTEYWRPPSADHYRPSMLDHIVTHQGRWNEPAVQGLCARLRCEPTAARSMDPEFDSVSDHCPVVIAGKL